MLLQHILVLLIVGACVLLVARNLVGTFRGFASRPFGSCCSKGCQTERPSTERVVFMPSEMLVRRKKT